LYARCPSGQRAYGEVPRNNGSNISLIATLTQEGISSVMTIEGIQATLAFDAYVEHFLLPTLRPGQTVVMDNLKVHYSLSAKQLIEAAGCFVLHLPVYSPDFNPIESAFSKLNTLLRQAKARTRDLLDQAIGAALGAITPCRQRLFLPRRLSAIPVIFIEIALGYRK